MNRHVEIILIKEKRYSEKISLMFDIVLNYIRKRIVMPRVLKLFEVDDREKLKEMFAYFEVVSDRADRDLFNCFSVTVLEILGNDEQILRKAKEYMGPLTTKNQREADLALGRKV